MGMLHFELAPEILEIKFKCWCPTENTINDNLRISGGVNGYSTGSCNFLLTLIHVVDKNNEYDRVIDGAKRHHVVCVFRAVGACSSKFVLGCFVKSDLMVAKRRIHRPLPLRTTKRNANGLITARNWVCNNACD